MGKAVQHFCAFAELLDCQSVILLIKEKSGLLTFGDINVVLYAVLADLHLRIEGLGQKALYPLHSFEFTHFGIASLINAADPDAVFREDFRD